MKTKSFSYKEDDVIERDGLLRRLWYSLVVRPVLRWQKWRCERAKAYLLTHDRSYRDTHIGHHVVRQRQKLYADGVSPLDRHIPDHQSVEEGLPPMSWPQ